MPKKNRSGFTLVELIVVITILAILGTIAFISLQGYTELARNAKRVDAIGKINTVLENQKVGGKGLLGFLFSGQEVIEASISGATPIIGTDYKAGEINPSALQIKAGDFTDPLYGEVYRVGVTSKSSGSFEAAATLEDGNRKIAKVIGSWAPRSVTSLSGTGSIGSSTFTLSNSSEINTLRRGDQVSGIGIPTGTLISKVSSDGTVLTLDQTLSANTFSIALGANEVASLIGSSENPNIPVTESSTNIPYASDTTIDVITTGFLSAISAGTDHNGNASTSDGDGNNFVAGFYDNGGNNDITISRLSTLGSVIWTNNIGGTGDDTALGISLDSNGNVYITGYFTGTVNFLGTPLTSAGNNDIFVLKLDSSGGFEWVTQMGGASADRGKGIYVDDNDNILVTGYFRGSADFGGNILNSTGVSDIFVTQLDSEGNMNWVTQMGGTSTDEGNSLMSDNSGNYIVTGFYAGNSTHGATVLTNSGSTDTFITKLDASGGVTWARKVGGTSNDRASGLVVDSANNIYIEGYFSGTSGHGSTTLTSSGSTDVFITKLDASGSFIWATKVGGGSSDVGNAISIDYNDNLYVTGYFGGTSNHQGTSLTSVGSFDIFITKFDSNDGSVTWARGMGSSLEDSGIGISTDLSGNSYTTGFFNGTFSYGSGSVTSGGAEDTFIIKLDRNGEFTQ